LFEDGEFWLKLSCRFDPHRSALQSTDGNQREQVKLDVTTDVSSSTSSSSSSSSSPPKPRHFHNKHTSLHCHRRLQIGAGKHIGHNLLMEADLQDLTMSGSPHQQFTLSSNSEFFAAAHFHGRFASPDRLSGITNGDDMIDDVGGKEISASSSGPTAPYSSKRFHSSVSLSKMRLLRRHSRNVPSSTSSSTSPSSSAMHDTRFQNDRTFAIQHIALLSAESPWPAVFWPADILPDVSRGNVGGETGQFVSSFKQIRQQLEPHPHSFEGMKSQKKDLIFYFILSFSF
jgi:hypothetical protein